MILLFKVRYAIMLKFYPQTVASYSLPLYDVWSCSGGTRGDEGLLVEPFEVLS